MIASIMIHRRKSCGSMKHAKLHSAQTSEQFLILGTIDRGRSLHMHHWRKIPFEGEGCDALRRPTVDVSQSLLCLKLGPALELP